MTPAARAVDACEGRQLGALQGELRTPWQAYPGVPREPHLDPEQQDWRAQRGIVLTKSERRVISSEAVRHWRMGGRGRLFASLKPPWI